MSASSAAEALEAEQVEPEEEGLASTMLFGFWYRAQQGQKVGRHKLVKLTLLNTALVLGRDSRGRAFALLDACPHKGMPLSYGWHDGDTVQCSFHGWKFDAQTGRCQSVPQCSAAQQAKVGKIRAAHVPCEERDGFIWVYLAEPSRRGRGQAELSSLPSLPTLPVFSERYRHYNLTYEAQISEDHAQVSQMDPAHGPFVHRRWWWVARHLFGQQPPEGSATLEPTPLGWRETHVFAIETSLVQRFVGAKTGSFEAQFILPNIRTATIRFGRFWITGLVTVTALTPTTCRFDQRWAWNAFYFLPFLATMLRLYFYWFFGPDRRILPKQAEGLGRIRRMTLMGGADGHAKWYYRIRRAYADAVRTGTEFVNPLRKPTTLRWRNPVLQDIQRHGSRSS